MPQPYNASPAHSRVYSYDAYGITIRSDSPLPLARAGGPALLEFEIRSCQGPLPETIRRNIKLEQTPFSAFDVGSLPGGEHYVSLRDVGEFLISRDGRSITGYRLQQAHAESFDVYLLGQAISFALVKSGFEPLHATAMVIEGQAVAFLGDCGFGKSTLAAAFLQAGYRLLTDDLLLLRQPSADLLAYPGAPRIKLFPDIARKFLGDAVAGVPMNPHTRKLIVPLEAPRVCARAVPLGAIYALASPHDATATELRIARMKQREAFVALLASTFNSVILDSARLRRQFEAARMLANVLPVKKLSYPRSLDDLPAVIEAVISDLCAEESQRIPCGA